MSNVNLEPKFVGNIEGDFYIPSYQRGYRWKEEVLMLLNDMDEIPEGQEYRLQPVVVKNTGEKKYELIDGQQRLTTILLIFNYIKRFLPKNQVRFSIYYEIRKNSHNFLQSVDFENLNVIPQNIDEDFLLDASKIISRWFNEKGDDTQQTQTAIDLNTKLNKRISVIWYEVNTEEDSTSLFTRLNIGRIPLTNAELVKALFLSRNNGIKDREQFEIATQWDIIEKELHNDNLWYFITNDDARQYATRIDLIFNLMAKKQKDERDKFFTFFHFSDEIKSKDKSVIWTDIQRYFQKLKEWFEDNDLYHKIGYLIATADIRLQELIDNSLRVTKTDFQKSLDELIAKNINFKKDYCDLSYENDYNDIKTILLLYNVETTRQKQDESMRFSFSKFKDKEQNWSLEHIHAQQSQGLNKKEQWVEWLRLHKDSLLSMNTDENAVLIQKIEDAEKDEKLTREQFTILFDEVIEKLSEKGNIEYIYYSRQ